MDLAFEGEIGCLGVMAELILWVVHGAYLTRGQYLRECTTLCSFEFTPSPLFLAIALRNLPPLTETAARRRVANAIDYSYHTLCLHHFRDVQSPLLTSCIPPHCTDKFECP